MNGTLAGFALLGGLALTLGAPETAAAQVPGGADSVKVRALAEPAEIHPGDQVSIAVLLEHAAGFHSWPNEPVVPPQFEGLMPIATSVEVKSLPDGIVVEEIEWPEPVVVTVRYSGPPVELLSYTDTTVVRVRLKSSPEQPAGQANVELRVRLQSCDERVCYPPRTVEVVVPLRLVPSRRGAEEISHGIRWMGDRAG
jgi:DsbC/DsbD-like thiol-disulfide interchange protein